MLAHHTVLDLELAPMPGVVCVQERYPVALCCGPSRIACGRGTLITVEMDELEPIVAVDSLKRTHELAGTVGACVVDTDDLQRPCALSGHRRERPAQGRVRVV